MLLFGARRGSLRKPKAKARAEDDKLRRTVLGPCLREEFTLTSSHACFTIAETVEAIVCVAEIHDLGCVACKAKIHVVEILGDMSILS